MPPKRSKTMSPHSTPQHLWKIGSLVWANFFHRWWSGMVVAGVDDDDNVPEGKYLVFWFADYKTSQVKYMDIMDFKMNYKAVIDSELTRSSKTWQKGVGKALQVLLEQNCIFTVEELRNLAIKGLPEASGYTINGVPEWVTEIIKNPKSRLETNASEEETKINCPASIKALITTQIRRLQPIEEMCLGCYTIAEIEFEHPLFAGKCCKKCQDRIRDHLYLKGDDGVCYYCTICGFPGEVIICEDSRCGRVYCRVCISDLAAPSAWEMYLANKNWNCFMCCEKVEKNGVIFRRADYLDRIQQLFGSDGPGLVPAPSNLSSQNKLRVLSLFDGIGTGLLVLDILKVPVDKYYSCEIDINAKNISKMHFGNRIIQLGDVRHLDDLRIRDISPIHLVLGGSPCNELSLVNPIRKGLYDLDGTGQLFFEFYRIICLLKKYNSDGFFWMFENVASMPLRFKSTINRFLQCQPTMADAAWVSAQCRPRLFWGNVPYMHQPVPVSSTHLQEYLEPERTAVVERIRTVTTRSNSLKQNTELQYPVLDSLGRPDTVWITELEKIFGFPCHYTDTGNLSVTQRQQVLGKSWSVPTVTFLLRFLNEIYLKNPEGKRN